MSDRAAGAKACLLALAVLPWVLAGTAQARDGRLLATGGASTVEGSAGGGIVPWATLAGYGERGQSGGTAFLTRVEARDYALDAFGAAYAWNNRFELSVARQRLDIGSLGLPLRALEQDILGAKLRLAGDLVYGDLPQVSLGLQYKRNRDFTLPGAVGARDRDDLEPYLVASRLFLAGAGGRHLLLNLGVRGTRANQMGLLGFGGDRRDRREWVLEGSAAVLVNPRWAVGLEYRQKPDNLGFAAEHDWWDAFVGWFPNKHVAVVAAWADLGDIAGQPGQRAAYLSLQWSY